MKTLLTGANGMLGHALKQDLKSLGTITPVDIQDFDITDETQTWLAIREVNPNLVVHSAAYTFVDQCEKEVDAAFAVNGEGSRNVANACRRLNAKMLFYSTDYVFDGQSDSAYLESDEPNPLSIYGQSKLKGEQLIAKELPGNHLIVRTSWLFGENGPNFINTIIKLAKSNHVLRIVDDQIGAPTYTRDLSRATLQLINNWESGIVHVSNSGSTTWCGLARYVTSKILPGITVEGIPTSGYPLPAPRPQFSVLSEKKFQRITSWAMPEWQDAVNRFIKNEYRALRDGETI